MKSRIQKSKWLPYARWIVLFAIVLLIVSFFTPYLIKLLESYEKQIDTVANLTKIITGIVTVIGLIKQYFHEKEPNIVPKPDHPEGATYVTNPTSIDEARNNIEKLMDWHDYETAVQNSERYLEEIAPKANRDDPGVLLDELDLRVNYSRALMYIGKIEKAINEIDYIIQTVNTRFDLLSNENKLITNEIIGLAHNHKGYISWMEFSRYEHALIEFSIAATFLQDHPDHLATVYDNMGRVYSQVGYHEKAKSYILQGLKIREKSGDKYRIALSLVSLAIVYLADGNPQRSYELASASYDLFCEIYKPKDKQQAQDNLPDRQSGVRGMGLASITKGQALRMLGTTYWREIKDDKGENNSIQCLTDALIELGFALIIFKGDKIYRDSKINSEVHKRLQGMSIDRFVSEPVRRFQAINELGCVYREIHLIQRTKNRLSKNDRDARELFKHKYVTEIGKSSIIHYVDAYEDLARLGYICNDLDNVIKQVEQVEQEVEKKAKDHLFWKDKKQQTICFEDCHEELWRHLAKLYILRGQTKLKKVSNSFDKMSGILYALEDYFLASLYMRCFLTRPINPNNDQLYPKNYVPQFYSSLVTEQLVKDLTDIINLDAEGAEVIKGQAHLIYEKYELPSADYVSDITDALNTLSIYKGRKLKFAENVPTT